MSGNVNELCRMIANALKKKTEQNEQENLYAFEATYKNGTVTDSAGNEYTPALASDDIILNESGCTVYCVIGAKGEAVIVGGGVR